MSMMESLESNEADNGKCNRGLRENRKECKGNKKETQIVDK